VVRRPLVGLSLSVVAGMLAGASGLFPLHVLAGAAAIFLVFALLGFRTKHSGWLVLGAVAMVSACRFVVGSATVFPAEINSVSARLPLVEVQVIGRMAGPPNFYEYRSGGTGAWVFPLACEGMQMDGRWQRRSGRIQVRVFDAPPEGVGDYGARMLLSGELRKRTYPGGEPVEMAASAKSGCITLSEPSPFSPLAWGQRLREGAAQNLSKGMAVHADQLAVYKALLLGYRKAIPQEINQQFRNTGTMHIFAISGLHVGMLGLFIIIVLKTAGVPRDWWGAGLFPLLLVFVCATGMKSSALRALTMATVYVSAPLFRRKPDVPTSIAFSATLLLWLKPAEILSAGFIYSFVVVSFLVMAFAALPDGALVRWQGWRRKVWAYVASLVITSAAAFIASMPLSALFFGSFSPVSLLGNLVVVPLAFCIVLSGWLSILLPFASEIFNHAGLVFINALLAGVGFFADLPAAHWKVSVPPRLAILFWYIGWISFLVSARNGRQRVAALSYALLAIVWATVPALLF